MTTMQQLPRPSESFSKLAAFTRQLDFESVPENVSRMSALLILDLVGVLAAATKMNAGIIARNFAANHWAAAVNAPSARMLFDGRKTSLPGFAFAMATQLDNLDAHDGWQPSKGHAGAAIFPALCAFAEAAPALSGRDALLTMVLGYEVSYRAAAALHATVSDYHTSGAWNALGCVAIGARVDSLDDTAYRHALGIAEYHGPRSQMMREIANPTMLHDGTGWGAPTGVTAVLLAKDGFTGAPAATVEFDDAAIVWSDLGQNWLTNQQYIKPYPICRWAHAPIDGALMLRRKYDIMPDMIERVEIATFAYSAELFGDVPTSSPMAQYSLAWPVAAALVRGRVGVEEILEDSFRDPAIVAMTARTSAVVEPSYEASYPARRLANVSITLTDGRVIQSGAIEASGGPEPQPTEAKIVDKYRSFVVPILGEARAAAIETAVLNLDDETADFKMLLELMLAPIVDQY